MHVCVCVCVCLSLSPCLVVFWWVERARVTKQLLMVSHLQHPIEVVMSAAVYNFLSEWVVVRLVST